MDESNAGEKFGIPPEKIPDYLALIGDSSDNVPGAPGVGPKTAVKLLKEYGDLEDILAHASEISGKRARESLTENADLVRLSKRLVTIQTDVPIELDLDRLGGAGARQGAASKALRGAGFPSAGRAVHGSRGEVGRNEVAEAGCGGDPRHLYPGREIRRRWRSWWPGIREAGAVSVDTETTSQEATRADLVGISLSMEAGEAYYLPLAHRRSGELGPGRRRGTGPPPIFRPSPPLP